MAPLLLSTFAPKNWTYSNAFNRRPLDCRKALDSESNSEARCDSIVPQMLRVLVVDDEKDAADSLATLIGRWGHVARLAYDGDTAMKAAVEQRPDVVLLDIEMPIIDGCQVARQLRVNGPKDECFIIAITKRADHIRRQQCIEAGIDVVLIKPVSPSVLETLLLLECMRANRRRTRQTHINLRNVYESGGFSC